jgi:hypothetical protein
LNKLKKPASTGKSHGEEKMWKMEKQPNDFSFRGVTKRSFQYLIDEFGFHLITDPEYYVRKIGISQYDFLRYESEKIFVIVGYASYDIELNLSIGFRLEFEQYEVAYGINEILGLAGQKQIELFPVNKYGIIGILPEMAAALKRFGTKAILGETEYYQQLSELRHQQSHQLMVETATKFIDRNIEKPWKKKQFKEVVRLYEVYEKYLTEDHKARLEFARQQLRK